MPNEAASPRLPAFLLAPLLLATACTAEVPSAVVIVEAPAVTPAPAATPPARRVMIVGPRVSADDAPEPAPVTQVGLPGNAPFQRGAAAHALGSVDLRGCAQVGSPLDDGHVTVTFGTDGTVTSAVVDGGPFPGTPEGGCVAGRFRAATVPPFAGAPVRVGKSFRLR